MISDKVMKKLIEFMSSIESDIQKIEDMPKNEVTETVLKSLKADAARLRALITEQSENKKD